jgi:predicted transcriptional regulator of viral defense system
MYNNSTFKNLSKQEVCIIARLSFYDKNIVSYNELKSYLPQGYKYTKQFVYNLKNKKVLISIKKGVYSFNPIWSMPFGKQINNYAIGNVFLPEKNYYLGLLNMFNSYGLTEQIPQTTFFINTSISDEKIINNLLFKFIKVKDEYMYGIIEKEMSGEMIRISDKERTMVDFIDYWNFKEAREIIIEILKNKECDIEKFINYSIRFPKIKVRKFIGLFLEEARISENMTKSLYESVKNTALISTSNFSRKGIINKKWGVINAVRE